MRSIFFIFIFLISTVVFSQNDAVAKNYFAQGEFEKALSVYQRLNKQFPHRQDYFLGVIQSLQELEQFAEVETLVKQRLNQNPNHPQLYVELGYNYHLQQKEIPAKNAFESAYEALEKNPNFAYSIGMAFQKYNLLEEAAHTFETAMTMDGKRDFNLQLAQIYGEQGKLEKMFERYLDIIERSPTFKNTAQRYFALYIKEDPQEEANTILRKTLLKRTQNNPDVLYYELLSWLFIQEKEWQKAFIQEKAIVKRQEDQLRRVYDLANIVLAEEDYDAAKDIIDFLIENARTQEEYLQGQQMKMNVAVITANPKDYSKIEKDYKALIEEFGRGAESYLLQIEFNHFLAFKQNQKEVAIENLKAFLKRPLSEFQQARVKMELADILVFDEQFNQALIFYSQIQNTVQSDVLAQEARFKVAKTSYFKGDFDWTLSQLDVLKKSTSQLIANDALHLSILIKDNSIEDSTQTALKKYARADLLDLQERYDDAIGVLDEILKTHRGESIEDEALLKQALIFEKKGAFTEAEKNYLEITDRFKDDILADDALFRLARLYETVLDQPEKAKHYYEQIIFNHADSIFFVEARRKYRQLRGDLIN